MIYKSHKICNLKRNYKIKLPFCVTRVRFKPKKWPPLTKPRFTTHSSYYLVSGFNPFITAFVYDPRVSSTINYNAFFTSNFDVLAVWQTRDKNFNVTLYHCTSFVTQYYTKLNSTYGVIRFNCYFLLSSFECRYSLNSFGCNYRVDYSF